MLSYCESEAPKYEPYRKSKFNDYEAKAQRLIDAIYDTSLKFADKKKLANKCIKIIESKRDLSTQGKW